MSRLMGFLAELRRRRVYRIAVVYAAAAFAVAQAADLYFERLGLPDWTVTLVIALTLAGFPIALVLGWTFDLTADGLRRTEPAAQGASHRPASWRLAAGGAATLIILIAAGYWLSTVALRPMLAIDRIAVLPLTNLMNDDSQAYFVDGMHEALISEMAQAGIEVIARASVRQYANSQKPIREIARELNVGAVMGGSVLRAGDSVRIQVQLTDAGSETHRWAQTYDGELRDVLALHRRVTTAVAREIRQRLTPQARERLADAPPVDPQAHDAYLRGISLFESQTLPALNSALELFGATLERDPTYALAHLGIYWVWAAQRQGGVVPPAEATPKMRAALASALALDASLPEVHFALAVEATWTDWDWAAAESSFRRALELNPYYAEAHAFYSHYLHIMQRPEEAMAEAERALDLDPFNPLTQAIVGGSYLMARRYDEALARSRTVLQLAPGSLNGLIQVSNTLHYAERYEEAFAAERDIAAGRGDPELAEALAAGYARAGYTGAMRSAADLLAQRALTQPVAPNRVARLYLFAGENELALDWLERALELRDPNLPYVASGHKSFDPVRDHPRFRALLRRMNLNDEVTSL